MVQDLVPYSVDGENFDLLIEDLGTVHRVMVVKDRSILGYKEFDARVDLTDRVLEYAIRSLNGSKSVFTHIKETSQN